MKNTLVASLLTKLKDKNIHVKRWQDTAVSVERQTDPKFQTIFDVWTH